jgi:hypothetical protein
MTAVAQPTYNFCVFDCRWHDSVAKINGIDGEEELAFTETL